MIYKMGNKNESQISLKIKSLFKSEKSFEEMTSKCALKSHLEPNRVSLSHLQRFGGSQSGNLRDHKKPIRDIFSFECILKRDFLTINCLTVSTKPTAMRFLSMNLLLA